MPDDFEFNDESLRRHGITRTEAIQVIESHESEFFPLTRYQDNDRLMFVGHAQAGTQLLEVGVEFLPNGLEKIFHANKARKFFANQYNERKG